MCELDHNDPSKPSHRLTNGPEPSKTIDAIGWALKKHSMDQVMVQHGQNHCKTIEANGGLKKH